MIPTVWVQQTVYTLYPFSFPLHHRLPCIYSALMFFTVWENGEFDSDLNFIFCSFLRGVIFFRDFNKCKMLWDFWEWRGSTFCFIKYLISSGTYLLVEWTRWLLGGFLFGLWFLPVLGKRLRIFFLLGDVGVEKCFRVDDGGVNLQTLVGFLNAQLLVCGSAKLSLGTDEHMGWEHR